MAEDIAELQERYERFVAERDWEEYHAPKNLAASVAVEAGELLEVFQWHDVLPAAAYEDAADVEAAAADELADVFIYGLGLAAALDIDVREAIAAKLDRNERRFDPETAAAISREFDRWRESTDE